MKPPEDMIESLAGGLQLCSSLVHRGGRGGGGTAPVNVRSVSKKHNAVRQADSGFGGRCLRKSSEAPLRPDLPLPVGPFNLMTFATGGTPHAGSRQEWGS